MHFQSREMVKAIHMLSCRDAMATEHDSCCTVAGMLAHAPTGKLSMFSLAKCMGVAQMAETCKLVVSRKAQVY